MRRAEVLALAETVRSEFGEPELSRLIATWLARRAGAERRRPKSHGAGEQPSGWRISGAHFRTQGKCGPTRIGFASTRSAASEK